MKYRLEKLRTKLEREICIQKPKLEVLANKREELSKRLASCSVKETKLYQDCQKSTESLANDEFKQIVQDSMRMKQLEVFSVLELFQIVD